MSDNVVILFKYDNKYYEIDDSVKELLAGRGGRRVLDVFKSERLTEKDISKIQKAIDRLFLLYTKEERDEDGFEEIAVFRNENGVIKKANANKIQPIAVFFDRGSFMF